MLLAYVAIAVLCVVCARYALRYLAFRRLYNEMPGCQDTTLLQGDLHSYPGFNEAGLQFDREQCKKYKYFHRVWFGPFDPYVFLYHPKSLRQVIKSSAPKPRGTSPPSSYDMMVPWLGEGLVLSNGAHWSRERRLLTPAFHFETLRAYHDVNNSCTNITMDRLKDATKTGQSAELYQLLYKLTFDVILQTAFSYKSNCQLEGETTAYTAAIIRMQELLFARLLNPVLYYDWIFAWSSQGREFHKLCKVAHEKSESIIARRRQELAESPDLLSGKRKHDFLDILLTAKDSDGNGLTDREIRDEVDTFLVAGHETTASGSMWTLYELSRHPEYQEKVYQEVSQIMGTDKDLAWDDLGRLPYTTQCIKEALRIHSPVPVIDRNLTEDVTVDGKVIPKGTHVSLYLWLLHHNPCLWEESDKYLPDRFHPDKTKDMDPFQFMPFSAGPRNCIGQHFAMNEMKVVVAKTIKNFRLQLDPTHKVEHLPSLTMRAKDGIYVYATPRHQQ